MVPDIFQTIGSIPRLPNGKIDRRRLTALAQLPRAGVPTRDPNNPRSSVEAQLLAVLQELFGHDNIGLDNDFFSLGGTSLLGMRYITRISEVYGVWLGAADLIRAPTVVSMAQLVTALLGSGPTSRPRAPSPSLDSPLGSRSWRPLAMLRAEGAFDDIAAAAIAYLPDDVLSAARIMGADTSVLRRLPRDDPQWVGVCQLSLGRIALVVVPRFGASLVIEPDEAVRAVNAALDYAVRLGARTAALTGLIPAVTDFGRAVSPRQGLAITTGHATTASAIVLTAAAASQAAQRSLHDETIAFVGLGAIGTAALRLMLARSICPRGLILCDVLAKRAELEQLAHGLRMDFGYDGDVAIVPTPGLVPDEVYRSRFFIGATNVSGVLDVERLSPGSIVVDDSFPHCFATDRAISRMSSRGDVLLVDGGFVSPPGTIEWTLTLPSNLAAVLGNSPDPNLLPPSNAVTACILSSILAQHASAAATIG